MRSSRALRGSIVPARVAALMVRRLDVAGLRAEVRGVDPEAYDVLLDITESGAAWRSQASTDLCTDIGTFVDESSTDPTWSAHASRDDLLDSAGVARVVGGISARGVLKAMERGRLPAAGRAGRVWLFDPEAVAAWAAKRGP